jgi:hypothetical protein
MMTRRNFLCGGWLVQRDFGSHLTLGGEIYAHRQDTDTDHVMVPAISAPL